MKVTACLNLVGLTAGFIGGLLLIFTLTLEPSTYQLVEKSDGSGAICHHGKKVTAGWGGDLVDTDESCPAGSVAPIIEANHPRYATAGMWLIVAGFLLQVPLAVRDLLSRKNTPAQSVSAQCAELRVIVDNYDMTPTELEVNRDIKIVASAPGPSTIRLVIFDSGKEIKRVELSRAQAILAGGDLVKNGSSEHLSPLMFTASDAEAVGSWIMRIAGDA